MTKEREKIGASQKLANILFIIVFLSGCVKKQETFLFRFIDHIDEKNVLTSPLKTAFSDPSIKISKDSSLAELANQSPLGDLGSGENPFGIKKKLHVGPADVNGLAAVPESHFQVPVRIPANSRLEFMYGIYRDKQIFSAQEGARAVAFRILLETKKSKKEIFSKTLRLVPRKTLEFNFKEIDLSSYAGEKAVFHFWTDGDPQALAFWFHPILSTANPDTKNIILISLDTLRADHLGCYGYGRDTSPAMDSLARDSAVFLNTYAASPWTLPSHLSLMTSLNTVNHRVFLENQKLDPSIPTLADFLKEKGLFNISFTGGGYVSGFFGFHKGFDSYHVAGEFKDPNAAGDLCRVASQWIAENQEKSFFLFLHTYQIHVPYDSPEPYNNLYGKPDDEFRRIDLVSLRFHEEQRFRSVSEEMRHNIESLYDGEIRTTDEKLISPLLATLRALKLYDRTMIILTSDHGEEFYEHQSWMHSHSLYNEVIKVPLIIKFFRSLHAGRRIEDPVRSIDIMPTILEEFGSRYPKKDIDGLSLLGLLKAEKSSGDSSDRPFLSDLASHGLVKHIPMKVSINQGRYKLILNERYSAEDLNYFLSPPPPLAETEVYDLLNDPQEKTNLAGLRPDLTRKLTRWLRSWYKPKKKFSVLKTSISEEVLEQLKSLGYI